MIIGWGEEVDGGLQFHDLVCPETFVLARGTCLAAESVRQVFICNHPDPTLPVFSSVNVAVLDAVIGLLVSIQSGWL